MNVRDLTLLLDYHYWARDRLLDALEPLTPEQFHPRHEQQLPIDPRYRGAHLRR